MEKQFIDKLAWIYIKNRKILSTRSRGKDVWYIPGGKREERESDQQALVREVREELNVDLYREKIQLYGIFEAQAHGEPEGTIVRMTCYTGEFLGVFEARAEVEAFGFLSYKDKDISSEVDKLIFEDLKKKNLID